MPTVIIDVGHGWKYNTLGQVVYDPGAVGKIGEARHEEHRVAQLYANALAYYLKLYDVEVLYLLGTREQPLSLQQRQRIHPEADAFVSIHLNAAKHSTAHGYETLYTYPHSLDFAEACHAGMQRAFAGRLDRGVKQAGLVACRRPKPAALLEVGFITNPTELEILLQRETRRRFGFEVARAILEYLSAG